MEKWDPVIEAFFRARDNYATGARTLALLLAAGFGFWFEEGLEIDVSPWVLGLFAAGLLSLFALIANKLRTKRQRPIDLLNSTREQLEEGLTHLENLSEVNLSDKTKPDTVAALFISIQKSAKLLKQSNIEQLPLQKGLKTKDDYETVRLAITQRIGECVDRVAELENRPGPLTRAVSKFKSAGSFSLRS